VRSTCRCIFLHLSCAPSGSQQGCMGSPGNRVM
jgi:hypothetical protein